MDYKSKYTGYQVEQLLDKADTALQSYTEQYKGTVTGVKINGTTKNPLSGVVDLGTVITAHQTLKTINGESILGSGNITIEGGNGGSDANVKAVDTSETLDDVNTSTYVKYVAQTLTDVQKTQARINIGAISQTDLSNVTVDLSNYYTKKEINNIIGDINTVLENIINGSQSMITFYLDDQVYIWDVTIPENTTWEQFVNTNPTIGDNIINNFRLENRGSYNVIKCYHEEAAQDINIYYSDNSYNDVYSTDLITNNTTYYLR